MKLQNMLFPSTETATEEELFFRRDIQNTKFILGDNKIIFKEKAEVSFDTYYNSFSIGKWTKYTDIQNLSLILDIEGSFDLKVSVCTYFNNRISIKDILIRQIEYKERNSVSIHIPDLNSDGSIIFTLKACKESAIFYGGYYKAEIDKEKLNTVRIAVGICTFQREKFVKHNLELLNKEFINNENSPLFRQIEVYVSDNGRTLDYEALNTDFIHVFPNKNLGGSGGFGRCMYEVCQEKESKRYSHILLMDDDVIIAPESIYRTYTFLKLLKPDYRDAFIGGAMLRLDKRYIQSEAADYYSMMGHRPVKYKYNLKNFRFVLKNEMEDPVNYFSWWYCVMPISVINTDNLPLPIFIKRDDIEYGIRNGKTFITLNGILVWHEPFENKRSGFLEYYYWRNVCILNAIHYPEYGKSEIKKQLLRKCVKYSLQYRYKDAMLCLYGVRDFLKGVDYLKTIDAEKLNKRIMQETYTAQNVDDIGVPFKEEEYKGNLEPKKESVFSKFIRYITFNGYLIPAGGTVWVPAVNTPTNRLFRVRDAIYFEEASGKAFKVTRNLKKAAGVLRAYLNCCRSIDKFYDIAKKEYNDRYRELITIKFWQKYLFSDL